MTCHAHCDQFDWVALSAMIIAGCALFVSLWQGHLSRKHSKLSLRPLVEIFTNSSVSADFGVKLMNVGTGPAIIRHVHIHYAGQKYDAGDQQSFESLMTAWEKNGLPLCKYFASQPDSNAALGVGGSFFVFQVQDSQDMEQASAFFRAAFNQMIVEVKYEGLYGDSYVAKHAGKTYSHA